MEIRKLGPADWQIQERLILESLEDSPKSFTRARDPWYEETSRHFFRGGGFACILIDDQRECGLLMGRANNLGHLWVAPMYRNKGNGSKLLNTFVAWAKEQNSSLINLLVNGQDEKAIDFYESNGFRRTGNKEGKMIEMELKPQSQI